MDDQGTTLPYDPAPDDPNWRPPSRLIPDHEFELLELLGRGGMGEVWTVEDQRQRFNHDGARGLVVKFLRPDLFDRDPSMFADFAAEASNGLEFQCPFLAPTRMFLDLTAHIADGWPPCGLVMDRYEPSLATILKALGDSRGTDGLRQELVIHIARDLVQALESLHYKYYRVHRDLKPGNVLVRLPKGVVWDPANPDVLACADFMISDFGTVCPAGQHPPFALGDDGWKAPELFDKAGYPILDFAATPAQDIFAFGKILLALLRCCPVQPAFLLDLADQCMHVDPRKRPVADHNLFLRLSVDYDIQEIMICSGFQPGEHPRLIGRQRLLAMLERYEADNRGNASRGGLFVITGRAGTGKTAVATHLAGEGPHHPVFFFSDREGRLSEHKMAEVLCKALRRRYRVREDVPEMPENRGAELRGLLDYAARGRALGAPMIRVIIDGIDEALSPSDAIAVLPKPPPAGILLIVLSRPAAADHDYLLPLNAIQHGRYEIRSDDHENMADIAEFFRVELPEMAAYAESLGEATQGVFQIAVVIRNLIRDGGLSVEEVLAMSANLVDHGNELLACWYRETWNRIRRSVPGREDTKRLTLILALLASAQAPLSESQVMAILEWDVTDLDWAEARLRWLINRRVGRNSETQEYYLCFDHQSAQEFVSSHRHQGPVRGCLPAMHALIARYYLRLAQRGWQRVEPYGRFFAVRHMIRSNDPQLLAEARRCLTDLNYLSATLGSEPGR